MQSVCSALLLLVIFHCLHETSSLPLPSARPVPGSRLDPSAAVSPSFSGPLGTSADQFFLKTFRSGLSQTLLKPDTDFADGYEGMMDMVRELHQTSSTPAEAVARARRTLVNLFPDFPPSLKPGLPGLLYWFQILFAGPFPAFSAKLNTRVTSLAAQWLMGPCEVLDLDSTSSSSLPSSPPPLLAAGDGSSQLLLVKRCRYLEEGNCASLCVHTCKLPTQQFFNEDMRVPMRMIPDYETYECRFEFGVRPTSEDEQDAKDIPCFSACSLKGRGKEIGVEEPCMEPA